MMAFFVTLLAVRLLGRICDSFRLLYDCQKIVNPTKYLQCTLGRKAAQEFVLNLVPDEAKGAHKEKLRGLLLRRHGASPQLSLLTIKCKSDQLLASAPIGTSRHRSKAAFQNA